jgi:CheY-like chemotaxis protein
VADARVSEVVLLAEDSDDEVLLFKRAYEQAAIPNPLRIVRDGEQAIQYLEGKGKFSDRKQFPIPRLLIVDLKMPRKTGFEVLQWARACPQLNGLRIVVMTTSDGLGSVKKAYELGANSFLVKAMDARNFLAQLKELADHWL